MRVLGLISGTSHDGIDFAVVDFSLRNGVLHGVVGPAGSTPYPERLRARLAAALPPAALTFAEVCELDTLIGQAFAQVAAEAAELSGGVDVICSHGQTVFHWVDGRQALGTLQIGQPAWIAERTGVPVVADVRARDVAAGGQGAPLVPVMDVMLLGDLPGRPAALNLGGIANLTVLRPPGIDAPLAYDTGPANALIDAAVARATGGRATCDVDGRLAASGRVDERLLDLLLAGRGPPAPGGHARGLRWRLRQPDPDGDAARLSGGGEGAHVRRLRRADRHQGGDRLRADRLAHRPRPAGRHAVLHRRHGAPAPRRHRAWRRPAASAGTAARRALRAAPDRCLTGPCPGEPRCASLPIPSIGTISAW
jgi:hypothetical protein